MVHKLQKELLFPFDGQQDPDFTLCLVRVTTSLFGHTLKESLSAVWLSAQCFVYAKLACSENLFQVYLVKTTGLGNCTIKFSRQKGLQLLAHLKFSYCQKISQWIITFIHRRVTKINIRSNLGNHIATKFQSHVMKLSLKLYYKVLEKEKNNFKIV